MFGEIKSRVSIGRYSLQVGDPDGATVREASAAERGRFRPRPTPVLMRPKSSRGLLDRHLELEAIAAALDAGLPIEVSGEPGIGKTAILRHLAHHPRAASFADGIVYLRARHQPPADLVQLIFEAFYESDHVSKPTDAVIRRGLQHRHALILLDDVHAAAHELEQVLDVAPRSAFALATRERCLWREVRSLELDALPETEAVALLEREIERPLGAGERAAAVALCADLEGHPGRILQAAALIREKKLQVGDCAGLTTSADLVRELLISLDDRARRALLALTALPGVPLELQHISGIAEMTDTEPAVMLLTRLGLAVSSQSRHRLVDGVADQLRRTEDLKPSAHRAITYFTAWAERNRRNPVTLLEESEALARAQQCAIDTQRWGEGLRLGRLLESALVVGARWGAWEAVLERCLAAAKGASDRDAEAWALHQLGTRALCLGESGKARAALGQAVSLREALGHDEAAAASRQNLGFVLAPEPSGDRGGELVDDLLGVDSLSLRSGNGAAAGIAPSSRVGGLALVSLLAIAAAGLLFWLSLPQPQPQPREVVAGVRSPDDSSRDITNATSERPETKTEPAVVPADASSLPTTSTEVALAAAAPALPGDDKAAILIFTARPGSISTGGPLSLCYAVNNAQQARIEPGVGTIKPAATLSCLRVTPARTTTYELTASGRDGQAVRQQLVIFVR